MAQSIKATVAALYTVCQSLYAAQAATDGTPVLVTYGPPAGYEPAAIVGVGMDIRQQITRPTMGTSRTREKEADIDIVISVYVPSGENAQVLASEKADDLAELLDAYFRTGPQEALSGACREAWLSSIVGPVPEVAQDPNSSFPTGRVATVTATVTARIRY